MDPGFCFAFNRSAGLHRVPQAATQSRDGEYSRIRPAFPISRIHPQPFLLRQRRSSRSTMMCRSISPQERSMHIAMRAIRLWGMSSSGSRANRMHRSSSSRFWCPCTCRIIQHLIWQYPVKETGNVRNRSSWHSEAFRYHAQSPNGDEWLC